MQSVLPHPNDTTPPEQCTVELEIFTRVEAVLKIIGCERKTIAKAFFANFSSAETVCVNFHLGCSSSGLYPVSLGDQQLHRRAVASQFVCLCDMPDPVAFHFFLRKFNASV